MPSAPSICLNGVVKRFRGVTALAGIDAAILPGRLTGLVGPDGAGKTTLMRLMAGLLHPDAGSITVMGCDTVSAQDEIAHLTGYMPQRFGLYEDLSVMENLRLYAELRALPAAQRADTFARLLDFTRLGPFTARLAGKLSGGMKQKLGLACALMARPKVLLLDEPGVGVDPVSRQDLWRMVGELTGEGMAVVWSTAYLDEAEQCATVLLLNEGKLAFQGTPDTLSQRLQGRCYRLINAHGDRRKLLTTALQLPAVSDGVIQGRALRLVLRAEAVPASTEALAQAAGASLQAVEPHFEDAFVDLLGGGPGGHSVIAELMAPVSLETPIAVSCQQLSKRFGRFTAADTVSLEVRQGEIFGLLGPNGAGKSTTFKMLCGLLRPSDGVARVTGLDLAHASSAAKSRIGYMAQKFSLYNLLSVRQNLEFSAGVYGLSGALRAQRIDEMIEAFELQRFLDAAPDDLSLGYRQRLALACAVMHRPSVLFLDEPTSGVDPITRREFWTHINGLVHKGVTVMVTTHFMDEAEYCDRVALMYRARVIALDTPDALKARVARDGEHEPTMEEAFIGLIEAVEAEREAGQGREKGEGERDVRQGRAKGEGRRETPTVHSPPRKFSLRRLLAIVRKESLQALRDPSTLLVAVVLPVLMLFLFAYAVSLDTRQVPIAIVLESDSEAAQSLAAAFAGSRYFSVTPARDRREVEGEVQAGRLRAYAVIPEDFSRHLAQGKTAGLVQIITDGTQPNTATFVAAYAQGVVSLWLASRTGQQGPPPIVWQPRFWFNPEIESHRAMVPGALAIIKTMIGTLLTALVIAREWERGTMEGLFSTPASIPEILFGKLLPYFFLGMLASVIGAGLTVFVFEVPLRGSVLTLMLLSAVFLIPALGQGLLISAVARNQFVAAQIALLSAFLPALLLSGFLFEISSMPLLLRIVTNVIPARHFNSALQTVFLAGDVWSRLLPALLAMLLIGSVFFLLVLRKTRKRLE